MFIACPHCRYLVATDPRGRNAPAHCPRCGGVLGDAAARDGESPIAATRDADSGDGGPSLARLLRRDGAPVEAEPDAPPQAEAIATGAASIEPEAVESPASADEPPVAEDTDIVVAVEAPAAASASLAAAITDPAPAGAPSPVTTPVISPVTPSTATPERSAARGPSFLHRSAHAPASSTRTPRWQWATLLVLAVALVLQVLLADRARLAGDAAWRPALASLCNVLGCSLPPWREPQAFAMLDRDVRPVPGAPGVLLARATFRNDARWSQPWPVLMLTLRDADGRTLGARAVRPAEYLPRDSAAAATLGPGQSAQVAVRVREPSANVVAFSFDFR